MRGELEFGGFLSDVTDNGQREIWTRGFKAQVVVVTLSGGRREGHVLGLPLEPVYEGQLV